MAGSNYGLYFYLRRAIVGSIMVLAAAAPVRADVEIFCRDLGHFGTECSAAELTNGGGTVFVDDVAISLNTLPDEPESDRVKVAGFVEARSGRPGLRFEVFEDALAHDVCSGLSLYSFHSFVSARVRALPIEVIDVTLSIDYSDVHTGSGANFDGAFLYGFMVDGPYFTPTPDDIGVDFFTPAAARDARNDDANSFLNVFPPAEVVPVTLVFNPLNPGGQDFRVDISQRSAPANSPLCGQITRVNGWTVTFGLPGLTPQQVNIIPVILNILLP